MDRELARETAELYALPPDEFTAARNARAKELRKENPALATQVAKLPKPTVAAAAINRLAREEPSEVRALAQSGRALRLAQEAALAGKAEATALTEATAEHSAALERVQREARRLRLSQPVLERVSGTLRASSLDPELQPLLERGLLAYEIESAGFGLDPGLVAPAAKRAPSKQGSQKLAQARAELKAARERHAEAKRAATAAERDHKRAVRELEQAQERLAEARVELDAAAAVVEQAQEQLSE